MAQRPQVPHPRTCSATRRDRHVIHELPEHLRALITDCKTVRAKVTAFKGADWNLDAVSPPTELRLRLLAGRIEMLQHVLDEDRTATAALTASSPTPDPR